MAANIPAMKRAIAKKNLNIALGYISDIIDDISNGLLSASALLTSKSVNDAKTQTVGPDVQFVQVLGFRTVNDGGSAVYARANSAPAHAGYFNSADGAFWVLAEDRSRPEFFGYDSATSDDARSQAVENANYFAYIAGRRMAFFSKKTYIVRSFKLYSGVTYDGAGSVMGSSAESATIRLANGTNPTTGFVVKGLNKSRGWKLLNLNIDGNKAANTSGHGIYLFAANDGVQITGDNDENALIDNVVIRNCAGDGLNINGDLAGYNIRQMNIGKLIIRSCNNWGIFSQTWSDSFIDSIAISGCGRGAMRANSFANNHITGCIKGFYNGNALNDGTNGYPIRNIDAASFHFSDSGRGTWKFEAQEEFASGFYFERCFTFEANVFADACGFPNGGIAARGAAFADCTAFKVNYIGDSFHSGDATPFLQSSPLSVSSTTVVPDGVFINATYRNQTNMSIVRNFTSATVGQVTIVDNGKVISYNGGTNAPSLEISADANMTRKSALRGFVDGSNNDHLYIDIGGSGTSGKNINLFRTTSSTGAKALNFFRGDNTSTLDHRITTAGSAEFSLFQGGVWNLGHITLGPWHIWVDGQGCLRQKNGSPTSATDGSIIGQVVSTAPATATSTGVTGQIAFDSSYAYFCTGANTWKRVAIASW